MNDKYYFMSVVNKSYDGTHGSDNFHYSGVTKEHPFKVIARAQESQRINEMKAREKLMKSREELGRKRRFGAMMHLATPPMMMLTGWQEIGKEEYDLAVSMNNSMVADNFDGPGYQPSND